MCRLPNHHAFMEPDTILSIAQEQGVDAVHPGYGIPHWPRNADFIRACRRPSFY